MKYILIKQKGNEELLTVEFNFYTELKTHIEAMHNFTDFKIVSIFQSNNV